jgi:hypothetical protein
MRRVCICIVSMLAGCLALSTAVLAGGRDPADYPLRVHILHYNSHAPNNRDSKSFTGLPDYIEGVGHADLFENGEPRGFQFTNSCTDPLTISGSYETYPARWKKKEKTLEILVPQAGKPWNMVACDLRTEMRTGLAYFWTEDSVVEESTAAFKDWMVKHQYDPEKGKDVPIEPTLAPDGAGSSASKQAEPK